MTFEIFRQFPDVVISAFDKSDNCQSDEECARRLGFDDCAKLKQVHGNAIRVVRAKPDIPPDGDGIITDSSHLALSVRFADCQAFAVYAPARRVIGLIHAGWRGVAAKIITAFFEDLNKNFKAVPEETYVGAVPSICTRCSVFSDPEKELPLHLHKFINNKNVDLMAAADAELDAVGVPKNQRERIAGCTCCGSGYWSVRGGGEENRNYIVAALR